MKWLILLLTILSCLGCENDTNEMILEVTYLGQDNYMEIWQTKDGVKFKHNINWGYYPDTELGDKMTIAIPFETYIQAKRMHLILENDSSYESVAREFVTNDTD